MKLLLDIGNTRIKWAQYDGDTLLRRGAVQHRGVETSGWSHELPSAPRPSQIIAANVAGSAVADGVRIWAQTRFGLPVCFPRAMASAGGIRNAYAVPELLGVDRWLGMIGVRRHCREPFLLAAAGTAFTVDLVDATGQHLGGVIAPGRSMMLESLKARTGNIAAAAAAADPRSCGMFGLNTAGAIKNGASHALAGLVGQAIRESITRCAAARLFVYGGDAGDVFEIVAAQFGSQIQSGVETMQDAVLSGLMVLSSCGDLS